MELVTAEILRKLKKQRAEAIEYVMSGCCEDYADYKHCIGRYIEISDLIQLVAETDDEFQRALD